MVDPGALLATTYAVGDDLRVRLRLCRPSDARRVETFLGELAPETRRAVGEVRDYTFFDPRERLVLAATRPVDGSDAIVGLADCTLLETGLAQLVVVVGDDAQGRGVGKLLTSAIATLARRQGATHLKASLREDNAAMMRLMARVGPTVRTEEDGGIALYTTLAASARAA
jgi:GNAT superfamily N-acetyltransferase